MWFFSFVGFLVIAGLLWIICRNTGEALDKQAALHYEIVTLNKRLEELLEKKPQLTSEKATQAHSSSNGTVAINAASLEELMGLPGVGKVLGQRIIDARPIADENALLKVQGVSKEFLEKLGVGITYTA